MNEDREILRLYQVAQSTNQKVALAVIVNVQGSAYRRPGAKMLVTEEGQIAGMVSGGCLERDVIRRARITMATGQAQLVQYDSRIDERIDEKLDGEIEEEGIETPSLGCEGLIEISIDPNPKAHLDALSQVYLTSKEQSYTLRLINGNDYTDIMKPPIHVVIFGAGPDSVPMAQLGAMLGWAVSVIDCRSSFPVARSRFQGSVDQWITCSLKGVEKHLPRNPGFVAILMTHRYDHDLQILRLLQGVQPVYTGILGPRARTLRILDDLEKEGFYLDRARLNFPMGLDIGGTTPQLVALSTLAEVQAILSNRFGGFLRDRNRPIHDSSEDQSRNRYSNDHLAFQPERRPRGIV